MSRFYYLISIQFLGYRYHGWQKQPNVKTLHLMVDRTLKYILKDKTFKSLAAGRTDAMVSANQTAIELFLDEPLQDLQEFLNVFNYNLPQDIRALKIHEVDADFNIIQHSKIKEYVYLFSEGTKNHPFCAPILATILEPLDVELMKQGAKLFEGKHYFKSYCYKATDNGVYDREILCSEIIDNTLYSANFFPEKTYLYRIKGKGFMRNQIRLMMGVLIKLGRGEVDLDYITKSIKPNFKEHLDYIAPASGLILNALEFKDESQANKSL